MKTILRIFIILAVAALIGGGILALVNASGNSSMTYNLEGGADMEHEGRLPQDTGGFTPGQFPEGMGRGHHGGEEGSFFSWIETVRNLIVVIVLIVIVSLIERTNRKARARKAAKIAVMPPVPGNK